jgi:hypothetical protein
MIGSSENKQNSTVGWVSAKRVTQHYDSLIRRLINQVDLNEGQSQKKVKKSAYPALTFAAE